MVSAGMQLVKYLLFIFNFVFFATGIAIIVVGTIVKISGKHYLEFVGNKFVSAPILLIVVGCIVTVIAFFGCCGAIKESYCMVMTFGVLLGIIFILEISAGIAAFVLRNDLGHVIEKNMHEGIKEYKSDNKSVLSVTWDYVQNEFNCCGINGSANWQEGGFVGGQAPDSCCIVVTDGCGKNSTNVRPNGCLTSFIDTVDGNVKMIGGVGVGIAFVQIVGVIFACCLASAIKKEYEVV